MEENLKELSSYEKIGNWNFDEISIEEEHLKKWDIYEELKKYVNEKSLVLDLGTGGGEKALKNIPDVGMLIGTDVYESMIKTANENLKMYPKKRAKFVVMDSLKMNFPQNIFDAVIVRHTVMNAKLIYESLKPGGVVLIEDIDKEDCLEIKKEFGRGQCFDDSVPLREVDLFLIKQAGFKKIERHEIVFNEYYKTKEDLTKLLIKTPIIDDFMPNRKVEKILEESSEESKHLEEYIKKFQTKRGIKLERRCCGFLAIK